MSAMKALRSVLAQSQEAARTGGLPVFQQLLEMLALKLFRNLGPNYYLMARFWRRDIPFRDKWRHANDREFIALIYAMNPPNYQKISQHKVIEKATLSLFNIPTPRFIAFWHPFRGRDRNNQPLQTAADLQRVLLPYAGQRVCFKAVEGFGGVSFAALDVLADGSTLQHPISDQRWTIAEWLDTLRQSPEGWLLEEYLPQHPELAAINASSLNTLRLWVIEQNGVFQATHALLRIGRAGSQVDNIISGGFGCAVDMQTGRLQAGLDIRQPHRQITHHPDSGVELTGRQLPYWQEALALGATALSAFPEMRFAGLDVAITPTGPAMIELNVYPARRSVVWWDLPHKDFFEPALHTGADRRG